MGAALSEDGGSQAAHAANARSVHRLLSNPSNIQESFEPVWRACCAEGQGTEEQIVPKSKLLEVLLRVVGEFERTDEMDNVSNGYDPSTVDQEEPLGKRTSLQLNHVFTMVGDRVRREEALDLFRIVLYSLQASFVMRKGKGRLEWPSSPSGYSGVDDQSSPQPGGFARGPGGQGISMRLRQEDTNVPRAAKGFQPTVVPAPQVGKALPSRHELEVESLQLANMSLILKANMQEEASRVAAMEEEMRNSEDSSQRGSIGSRSAENGRRTPTLTPNKSDSALVTALEGKVGHAELEVAELELRLRTADREMTDQESAAAEHELISKQLGNAYMEEISEAAAISSEAFQAERDFEHYVSSRRHLEYELASQAAHAKMLRKNYEGQKLRCSDFEAEEQEAKQNAELAYETRLEADAKVERAELHVRQVRQEKAEHTLQLQAQASQVRTELAEIRDKSQRVQAIIDAGLGPHTASPTNTASSANAAAEAAGEMLRLELSMAEQDRDHELSEARSAAQEVSELEIARARLQGQLASREGELRAAQRRSKTRGGGCGSPQADTVTPETKRLGTSTPQESFGIGDGAQPPEAELMRCTAMLRYLQHRTAEVRRRERDFEEQLRVCRLDTSIASPTPERLHFQLGGSTGSSGSRQHAMSQARAAEAEAEAEQAWLQTRHFANELGEARAALQRHHIQIKASPVHSGDMLLLSLAAASTDAQRRDSDSSEQVEALKAKVIAVKERWRHAFSGHGESFALPQGSRSSSVGRGGRKSPLSDDMDFTTKPHRASEGVQRAHPVRVRESASSPLMNNVSTQPVPRASPLQSQHAQQQQQQQQQQQKQQHLEHQSPQMQPLPQAQHLSPAQQSPNLQQTVACRGGRLNGTGLTPRMQKYGLGLQGAGSPTQATLALQQQQPRPSVSATPAGSGQQSLLGSRGTPSASTTPLGANTPSMRSPILRKLNPSGR